MVPEEWVMCHLNAPLIAFQLNYSIDLQAHYLQQSMWADNMLEQKPVSFYACSYFSYLTVAVPAMSYEEPEYSIVKKTDVYEVRQYKKRTEVTYGEEDSGFRVLFDYISGPTKAPKKLR